MNLYFLLEGKRTELKIYPKWISYLLPHFKRVPTPHLAKKNTYFMISGQGYPSLLDNHLRNSIEDINETGLFDYLVILLDTEEDTVESRVNNVNSYVVKNNLILNNCKLKIIPQHRCIETWLLGNTKVFPRTPENEILKQYIDFFSVLENDPELLPCYDGFTTHAQYHYDYLKKILAEKNIRYSKVNPSDAMDKYYLENLIQRTSTSSHLPSLNNFVSFCTTIATNTMK